MVTSYGLKTSLGDFSGHRKADGHFFEKLTRNILYKNLDLKEGGTRAGGGSPCTPSLRSRFVYRILHMNFPGGAPGHRNMLENVNVIFTTKNLQLVYPPL